MLAFPLIAKRLPVSQLVLVGEEVGPVLGLLEDSDEASVVVLESGIPGSEKFDADVDASTVKDLCFAVFAEI